MFNSPYTYNRKANQRKELIASVVIATGTMLFVSGMFFAVLKAKGFI